MDERFLNDFWVSAIFVADCVATAYSLVSSNYPVFLFAKIWVTSARPSVLCVGVRCILILTVTLRTTPRALLFSCRCV